VNVEDHLTALEEAVGEEFARTDGHGTLGRHAYRCECTKGYKS
jgi:hypothetical protein